MAPPQLRLSFQTSSLITSASKKPLAHWQAIVWCISLQPGFDKPDLRCMYQALSVLQALIHSGHRGTLDAPPLVEGKRHRKALELDGFCTDPELLHEATRAKRMKPVEADLKLRKITVKATRDDVGSHALVLEAFV